MRRSTTDVHVHVRARACGGGAQREGGPLLWRSDRDGGEIGVRRGASLGAADGRDVWAVWHLVRWGLRRERKLAAATACTRAKEAEGRAAAAHRAPDEEERDDDGVDGGNGNAMELQHEVGVQQLVKPVVALQRKVPIEKLPRPAMNITQLELQMF